MNWKLWLWKFRLPVAAALIGLAITLLIQNFVLPPPSRQVLVVTAPVKVGEELSNRNTDWRSLPVAALPDATLAATDLDAKPHAAASLTPGQVLTPGMISENLTRSLPSGFSAVTIPVDQAALALVKPGRHVDIFSAPYECQGECNAKRVAHNAIVISVHADKSGLITTSSQNFVTIAVSSEQTVGLLGSIGHQPFNVSVSDP